MQWDRINRIIRINRIKPKTIVEVSLFAFVNPVNPVNPV
jgi:hypothetical protein